MCECAAAHHARFIAFGFAFEHTHTHTHLSGLPRARATRTEQMPNGLIADGGTELRVRGSTAAGRFIASIVAVATNAKNHRRSQTAATQFRRQSPHTRLATLRREQSRNLFAKRPDLLLLMLWLPATTTSVTELCEAELTTHHRTARS